MINIKIKEGHGHVCSVPGCGNRNTKAISRSASGKVIYICEECIAALAGKKEKAKKDEDKGGEEE